MSSVYITNTKFQLKHHICFYCPFVNQDYYSRVSDTVDLVLQYKYITTTTELDIGDIIGLIVLVLIFWFGICLGDLHAGNYCK